MQSATAIPRPMIAPMIGPADSEAACRFVQTKSAVSRPSRATATNEVTASAADPRISASDIFPLMSPAIVAAVFRMKKTIHVIRPTAIALMNPTKAAWALLDNFDAVKVSTKPKLRLNASAAATPIQTGASERSGASLRTALTRIVTINPASRPSRRPIIRFGRASAHAVPTGEG